MKARYCLATMLLIASLVRCDRNSLYDAAKMAASQQNSLFNLHATTVTYDSITLVWNAVEDVVTYRYFRSFTDDFTSVGPIEVPGTTYTDSGLTPGTTYYFMVCASYADGGEDCSKTLTMKTATLPLTAPGNLAVASKTSTTVNLEWDAVAGAARYLLYRENVLIADLTTTYFSDSYRASGSGYNYTVSAVDGGNTESEKSAVLNVTTLADNFDLLDHSLITAKSFSTNRIYGSNADNHLPVGTIVFFHTRNGLYGKFEVQQFDYTISNDLILRIVTYDGGGSAMFDTYATVRGTFLCDLDTGGESLDDNVAEFQWLMETATVRYIEPLPAVTPVAEFYIHYTP